jgi:hypothetical protein
MKARRNLIQIWLLCCTMLPAVVQAQFTFTTNNGAITITGYTGPSVAVVIPSTINGHPVTTIGDGAFSAFWANSTSPTSLTIPDSVTNIGNYVFDECFGLTNIIIGAGVRSIGTGTFVFCFGLNAIIVNPTNSFYSSVNGILFDKSQTTLIQYPEDGQVGSYPISNSVTSLGDTAFELCGLSNITIPNSVTNIGNSAFQNCSSLTNITIDTNVTSIGANAFYSCSSLNSITVPNSVTSIGVAAFEASGLKSVTIPNSVTSIASQTFDICGSLTNITIPNSVTSIGYLAFYSCGSLTSIVIPDSVTNIGSYAFSHCFSLTNVYFIGNAPTPTNDLSVFQYDNNATVYYFPGTTGWGTTFDGLPTAPWLPQVQSDDASFGIQTNQFGFNMIWASGQIVVIEACTNLSDPDWQPVQTNRLSGGSSYFSDPQWTNYPGRFYRLRSQ